MVTLQLGELPACAGIAPVAAMSPPAAATGVTHRQNLDVLRALCLHGPTPERLLPCSLIRTRPPVQAYSVVSATGIDCAHGQNGSEPTTAAVWPGPRVLTGICLISRVVIHSIVTTVCETLVTIS